MKGWECGKEVVNRIVEDGLREEDLECFALTYWRYATLTFLREDGFKEIRKVLESILQTKDAKNEGKRRINDLLDRLRAGWGEELKGQCGPGDLKEGWEDFVKRIKGHFHAWYENARGEVWNWLIEDVLNEISEKAPDNVPVERLRREVVGLLRREGDGFVGAFVEVLERWMGEVEVSLSPESRRAWRRYKKDLQRVEREVKKASVQLNKVKNVIDDLIKSIGGFSYHSRHLGFYYFNKGQVNNPKGNDPGRILKFHDLYVSPAVATLRGDDSYTGDEHTCTFCGRSFSVPKDWKKNLPFTEGDFAPLGVSVSQFPNFFYDGNTPEKCPVCQLLLLCSFAGFNRKPWPLHDVEGTDHIFVYMPDVGSTYRTNENFAKTLRYMGERGLHEEQNLYIVALKTALESVRKRSSWVLQNILFVEIKPTPSKQGAKPKLTYFGVDRGMAMVFAWLSEGKIESLSESLNVPYDLNGVRVNLGTEVLKRLLNRVSLKGVIFPYFKDYLEGKGRIRARAVWWMLVLEHLINFVRRQLKGGGTMNESVEKAYRRLWALRRVGGEVLKQIDPEKRRRIGQRFIGLIRGGRKEEFYNELLRLFVVYEEEVPDIVFSLLTEEDHLTFQEKALAFLSGFVSPGTHNSDKEENKEVVQSEA